MARLRQLTEMQRLLLIAFVSLTAAAAIGVDDFPYLKPSQLQTETSADVQKVAAQKAICSFLQFHPQCAEFVRVIEVNHDLLKDEKDSFTFWTENEKSRAVLKISASSGVAAVWGFHFYAKEYLNWHVGWQVRNIRFDASEILPPANKTVVVAGDRFRYYQNVCTSSYSFVWWSAAEWEAHIYWMALNGINLSLAPLGQEEVWRRVYTQFGLTEDEIQEHFTGPAFLSWQRMGNVRGWGGPLPQGWHANARIIQRRILKVMRDLGMVPVLPAFAGHVPRAFARLFPNASLLDTQTWNSFSDDYCCPMFVHPADPLFRAIGTSFLRESALDNGLSHVYNADPFNELRLTAMTNDFVRNVGAAIFSSMSAVDPSAVWLLQNWMFVHDSDVWPRERVRAFLRSVPLGRALVLDLQSEQWPQYYAYDMYFGQPFVWCMLHNFGGTLGMFGNMHAINGEVYVTREHANSTMLGIGLTMEGINQNYVVYDLMLETAWRRSPVDLDQWTASYARRRYGCGDATARGWRYLLRSVYSFRGLNRMRGKYVMTRQPSLGIKPWAWYKSRHLFEAWREFAAASGRCRSSDAFLHDLTDITRQALQYRAEQLYLRVVDELHMIYNMDTVRDHMLAAREAVNAFLEVMNDMDKILSTRADFSLWSWLQAASRAADPGDDQLYEMNARNQITLWGPNGEISDYACKQWAGMFRLYYLPRWQMFFKAVYAAAMQGVDVFTHFDQKITQKAVLESVNREFATMHVDPPNITDDGTRIVALRLLDKWGVLPDAEDLPQKVLYAEEGRGITLADTDDDKLTAELAPSVRLQRSTTPLT